MSPARTTSSRPAPAAPSPGVPDARPRSRLPTALVLLGAGVVAAGVVALPLINATQGCRSERDATLADSLPQRPELTLHPTGTGPTETSMSTGCGEDGVAYAVTGWQGASATDVVPFYDAELSKQGWQRVTGTRPEVAGCWSLPLDGTTVLLTVEGDPRAGSADADQTYTVSVAAAHDATPSC